MSEHDFMDPEELQAAIDDLLAEVNIGLDELKRLAERIRGDEELLTALAEYIEVGHVNKHGRWLEFWTPDTTYVANLDNETDWQKFPFIAVLKRLYRWKEAHRKAEAHEE